MTFNALIESISLGLISVTVSTGFLFLYCTFTLTMLNSFFNRLSFIQLSLASYHVHVSVCKLTTFNNFMNKDFGKLSTK